MVCWGALKRSYTNHSVSVAIRLRMGVGVVTSV